MTRPAPPAADLKPLLDRAAADYETLKKNAQESVERWMWANGPMGVPKPGFDAEIHGTPAATELRGEPKKRAGAYEHGLDDRGRVVVRRGYSALDGHFTEDFVFFHDDRAEQWSYGPHPRFKDPRGVTEFVFQGGRPVAYRSLNADGRAYEETYEYDEGRLKVLKRIGRNPDFANVFIHEYDASDEPLRIVMEDKAGARRVVYRRPALTAATLTKRIRSRLTESIPKRVAALEAKERAFCLALVYDRGSALSMLPPKLAVGLESERERWRKSSAAPAALWDAQSFASFDDDRLELADAALLQDTRELAEHMRRTADLGAAHELLVEIARALNKSDFARVTKVTPDFVVYPVDIQLEQIDQDLAAAIPAARLKALRKKKEI